MNKQAFGYSLATVLTVATLLLLVSVPQTQATNGYFSHGFGVASKAMGGVATALPRDGFAAASNPAGMVWLGDRYDINAALFNPSRQYSVTGNPSMQPGTFPLTPQTLESGSNTFVIPGLAANWMINPRTSFGISIYGNGGMNTDYDAKVFDNPAAPVTSPTGVNLMQLFASMTFARKLAPNHSVGVSVITAYQMFEAKGLQAFGGFSSDPTMLSDNDMAKTTGLGARVGYLGTLTKGFDFGASYQTKINMAEMDQYA